jgi:hypothetical protein
MASLSPALRASRPGAFIDPHRQAEYPVLLGESLRGNAGAKAQFYSLQYNWKPKVISAKQRTVITKADGQSSGDTSYLLTIQEPGAEDKPYTYTGKVNKASEQSGSPTSSPVDQTASLALVFNEEKSAFILEKISAALDFNITSAPGQSRADIQAHPQLTSGNKPDEGTGALRRRTSSSSNDDDDEPDAANPYDYRHFLEEAKANIEKGLGSRTPIPGGLSGFPSPAPTASRFRAGSGPGTPLHKPVTSTPSTQTKKRKISDQRAQDSRIGASTTATHKAPATKPRPKPAVSPASSKSKPLSKARISDSDEEIGDTITLSRPPPAGNAKNQSNKPPAATTRTGYAPSPRIEVDEAADLVIDMGSPPPPVARRQPPRVDSPFAIARTINPGTSLLDSPEALEEDEEEQDAEGEPDYDLVIMDPGTDADVPMRDVDSDVEDLVLGSPAASTTKAPSVDVGVSAVRVDADVDADEDEDDELAAELEAALENDDEDGEQGGPVGHGGGVGLGISTGGGGAGGEDESEISEEE